MAQRKQLLARLERLLGAQTSGDLDSSLLAAIGAVPMQACAFQKVTCFMVVPRPVIRKERANVWEWMPDHREFGYSREEAEQIARIAERLWIRYTARGLTIDCPN